MARILEEASDIYGIIILNSYFDSNTALIEGGAIKIKNYNVLISNCEFSKNKAKIGGVIDTENEYFN